MTELLFDDEYLSVIKCLSVDATFRTVSEYILADKGASHSLLIVLAPAAFYSVAEAIDISKVAEENGIGFFPSDDLDDKSGKMKKFLDSLKET